MKKQKCKTCGEPVTQVGFFVQCANGCETDGPNVLDALLRQSCPKCGAKMGTCSCVFASIAEPKPNALKGKEIVILLLFGLGGIAIAILVDLFL